MSNLLSSLVSSGNALRVFEQGLAVAQNNVGNVNTPGYVKQRAQAIAMPFDAAAGLSGGVEAGAVRSSRDLYAEQYVRQQTELSQFAEQSLSSLTVIENVVSLSAPDGIPAALNSLFQSFSAWSQDPNSQAARQSVMQRAEGVAAAFRHTADQLNTISERTTVDLKETAAQINQLAARLQEYNRLRQQGGKDDAGLDAKIHSTLEDLSTLVNVSVLHEDDGTVTVMLGGQSLLVSGEDAYPVTVDFRVPSDPPPLYPDGGDSARIINSRGRDITDLLSGGKTGALLDIRNRALPALLGDSHNLGSLNRLATTLATEVNTIVGSGWVRNGESGAAALFQVDPDNPTGAAKSLIVDPLATAANLPAIEAGDPPVSNGAALQLANLSRSQHASIENLSLVQYYGAIASSVGNQVQSAQDSRDQQQEFAAQARAMRDQVSGVSLDEEAIVMLEFQRAYQATARLIATLSELTEEAINLVR
jgi:flagellar hook-associated protein 1 FlgK